MEADLMNRKLIAFVFGIVVLAACGITLAQSPSIPLNVSPSAPQPVLSVPSIPSGVPSSNHQPVRTDVKPDDLTIDQILDAVETIREEKAELEKKEKVFLKALHRKAEKLKERMERVEPDNTQPPTILVPASPVPPPVVAPGSSNSSGLPTAPGSP
jgi:hypothetical protein